MQPRYPVYVISKGRHENPLTAKFLITDGVDFRIVVEPQEADAYRASVGGDRVLVLPFSNLGLGSIPARNWVWEHAKAAGAARHWILDDNINKIYRRFNALKMPCEAGPAFAACEDFTDRYENIAIAGMNYEMFSPRNVKQPPLVRNVHVYSCLLIDTALPYRWRGRYNEDTDLCLQVLASGLCTVLFNVFLIDKVRTMVMKGGNSAELYQGSGRLKMAKALERAWPCVVTTRRRFNRPQHVIFDAWKRFDQPLILKPGVEIPKEPNEYGMKLVQVKDEIKSARLRAMVEGANRKEGSDEDGQQS